MIMTCTYHYAGLPGLTVTGTGAGGTDAVNRTGNMDTDTSGSSGIGAASNGKSYPIS